MKALNRRRAGLLRLMVQTAFAGLMLAACDRSSVREGVEVVPILSDAEWSIVGRRRVLFGHQSVGRNILDGVAALAAVRGVALNIAEEQTISSASAGLYHFTVGENGDPVGKLRHFRDVIGKQNMDEVDIALLKLCYVDFTASSDPASLAGQYVGTLKELQLRHPGTRFIGVTAPLTTVQTGPKAWIKRLLGRPPYGMAENARRHEFNEILRAHFEELSLFDLARLEAAGESQAALHRALTSDGGHLNEQGRELAGAAFVKLVASSSPLRPGT